MHLPQQKGPACRQAGFGHIFVILIVIASIASIVTIYLFFQRTKSSTNVKGIDQAVTKAIAPPPAPSPWKTYKNQAYNLGITYPRAGVVWDEGKLEEKECGNAIKEEEGTILVDNFYKVKIVPFKGALEEYLISKGAAYAYEKETITDSGADEAVRLLRLKEGFEIAVGYPPLVYVKAVFKRGDNVFLLQEIVHNPSNVGGCVQPSVVDPTKYPEIAKQTFDITTSLKFF